MPARFHYQTEQDHAHRTESFAPDLVREQQRFLKAQLVIWLYPIWWGGVPAILKGWFDRVLAYGFAYSDGRRYDCGFFHGKHGMLCLSTGGTEARFSQTGVYGTIDQVLWPVQRLIVEYLGIRRWRRSLLTARRASIRRRARLIWMRGGGGFCRSPRQRKLLRNRLAAAFGADHRLRSTAPQSIRAASEGVLGNSKVPCAIFGISTTI